MKKAPTVKRGYESFDWYETPVYYDAIFDVDSGVEGDFLEAAYAKHASSHSKRKRRLLEPASGSGRLLVEMGKRGWSVQGFDLEPNMVDFARERLESEGLAGVVKKGHMARFKVRGKVDLAHCLVSTFKYLLTEDEARGHLASVAAALRRGGIYALGFHLTSYHDDSPVEERWSVKKDGRRIRCAIKTWPADPKSRLERVRARLRVREKGEERRAETKWRFRCYNVRQVKALLKSVPELEHVATYDFHYEIDEPQKLTDEQCDTLLILRKRSK